MRRLLSGSDARAGFTLAEMLVAMALLAVLAAVVVPNIFTQVTKGEISRTINDMKAVGTATKLFYGDVQRWPASMTQLNTVLSSSTASNDIYGTGNISAELGSRWSGPYIERGEIPTTGLPTGLGGSISNTFTTATWNGNTYLLLSLSGVTEADARRIDKAIDGSVDLTSGAVRYSSGTLQYLAAPIGQP